MITQEVDTEIDENDDHWEHNSIQILLNVYLQNVEKFRNPKIRKKSVWIDISNAVGKSPDCCDKKFRNLKQTYIRLLKKKNLNSQAVVKWPYFEIFQEIYSDSGECQPAILQKIQEATTDNAAKALLTAKSDKHDADLQENGESSSGQTEEVKKRLTRKRHAEFRKVTSEMRDRQKIVEEKLDRLIHIVEESNNIQKERNRLFEQFLERLNHAP